MNPPILRDLEFEEMVGNFGTNTDDHGSGVSRARAHLRELTSHLGARRPKDKSEEQSE